MEQFGAWFPVLATLLLLGLAWALAPMSARFFATMWYRSPKTDEAFDRFVRGVTTTIRAFFVIGGILMLVQALV